MSQSFRISNTEKNNYLITDANYPIHSSNFEGTWGSIGGLFSIDENGTYTGPQSNTTPPIQIVATSDPNFYQILTSNPVYNRIAVVGKEFNHSGQIIGYYLLTNGKTSNIQSQRTAKLVPIEWDESGNPTKLYGIGESVSYKSDNIFRLTYDVLTKIS